MNKNKLLRIRQERLKRGWTQQQLAFFADVGVSDVSRIETGRVSDPYPTHAKKLARILGINPKELTEPAETEAGSRGVI